MRFFGLIIGILMILAQPVQASDGSLYIVATTGQVADIVKNVAKDTDHVRIEALMGTGVDPHLYRPTRSDIAKLSKADMVFYNGLHLEGQMVELLEKMGERKPVIPVTERLSEAELLGHDPHVWMDVKKWLMASDVVTLALEDFDPAYGSLYHKNAQFYKAELVALDDYVRTQIASIPADKRLLITAHDAFGYFGDAYGIEVVGLQGLSTESEAGLKVIEDTANLIASRKIPAVFSETSVSARNINALLAGAKARGAEVALGGTLYSDSMGSENTKEGAYVGMMVHNVTNIVNALGGEVVAFIFPPPTPEQLAAVIVK